MRISQKQYERIEKYFPKQRGNVKISNYDFINAILYIAENGCKWRALPKEYGKWYSIYKRFNRWVEKGVIQRIFSAMQQEKIISIKVEVLAIDSTSCKVHPDAHGALKNEENRQSENQKADGIPSFTWYPQTTRLSLKCTSRAENVTTVLRDDYQLKKQEQILKGFQFLWIELMKEIKPVNLHGYTVMNPLFLQRKTALTLGNTIQSFIKSVIWWSAFFAG